MSCVQQTRALSTFLHSVDCGTSYLTGKCKSCFSNRALVETNSEALKQGKTTWVDSACADCPGFLGPGCCSCPSFHLRLGASDCSPGLAFCFMGPWTFAWICCSRAKTGRTAHVFTAQEGTRRLKYL